MKQNPILRPTLRSQMFSDVAYTLNRKILRKQNRPWMKSKELDIILEVLHRSNPARCLEWGGGLSTSFFPNQVKNLESWVTIEHHKEWYQYISTCNKDPRVTIHLVEPDDPTFETTVHTNPDKREGLYADFKSYIEFFDLKKEKFDFIFIDGRARKECLKKSIELISDHGTIIVHDANRDHYFTDAPPFSSTLRLVDYRKPRKCGGIWIGRKNGDVAEVLDVAYHQKLWEKHDNLAKALFLR